MNNLVPIKTEYRGIVFDSKSEAIFARCLDLAGFEYDYHVHHCDHEWDFLVHTYQYPCHYRYNPILVEYKPREPTMTYVNNLIEKTRFEPKQSILVWGSPWGPAKTNFTDCHYHVYPIFSDLYEYGWGDFEPLADSGENRPVSTCHDVFEYFDITPSIVRKAFGYRFDLRDGY